MKFNRSFKQALSGVVISSLLFGNVGYSLKNENRNNLIENSSKKDNGYIINSNDKQGLKKILVPVLGISIPTLVGLTCLWLLSSNSDSEDKQNIKGQDQPKPIKKDTNSGGFNSDDKRNINYQNPTNLAGNTNNSDNEDMKHKPKEEIHENKDNGISIKTIIDESNETFNNNGNSTAGVNNNIVKFYSERFNNLGQIITRYFSLVMWSQNSKQAENFQNGALSKWFIGAVNEYFITKHGNSDNVPQKNTELIKNELTALYNEKDAQNVVKIACEIVAKIASKLITYDNPVLTESLIKYHLSILNPTQGIIVNNFPGSDAYIKRWDQILENLKEIDFINSWNNIDDCLLNNEEILDNLANIYSYLVPNSKINDLTNDVNDYNNMGILSNNQSSIYYNALYNILYMKKYATENHRFLVSRFNSIRSYLIKIAKERLREQLAAHIDFESFKRFNDIDGYLNSVAEEVIEVKRK